MPEKLIQIAERIAEEIAERQELETYLNIIDNPGGTLEDFISETCNFCVDTKSTKNGHPKKIDDADKQRCHNLVESVLEYGRNLVLIYNKQNRFDLFSTTLMVLKPLDCDDKQKYINQFKGFIEMEDPSKNTPILPIIIQKVLSGIIEKYQPQFEKLKTHNIKREDPLYQTVLEELKSDLKTFVQYTLDKLEQNAKYHSHDILIEYNLCFPTKKQNDELKPEHVLGFIERGSPQELIDEFGPLLGMAIRGPKGEDENTIVIYHGDPNNPKEVRIQYPQGVSRKGQQFYIRLSSKKPPIPELAIETRKARDALLRM